MRSARDGRPTDLALVRLGSRRSVSSIRLRAADYRIERGAQLPSERDDRAPARLDLVDIRRRPPGRDAGLPAQVTSPRFVVRVSLRDDVTTGEELTHETTTEMADFEPRFGWDSAGRPLVTLQVTATDLWVAVLLAMGAVTGTGHQPERIEAMPSAELESPHRSSPGLRNR